MSNKPKIFATCPAGCLWETVHKEDFEKSASIIPVSPSPNGQFILEKGKTYKIKKQDAETYGFQITIRCRVNSDTYYTTHIFRDFPGVPDEFNEYVTFRLLAVRDALKSVEDGSCSRLMIYEWNGFRQSYYELAVVDSINTISEEIAIVTGATECFIYNEDATIKGEKGDNVFVRYSANADGTDFADVWSSGMKYMGVATAETAPTNKEAYNWVLITGIGHTMKVEGHTLKITR